ncbi:MAG: hypothetical protein ACXW2X_11780, partial [Thermoanaerobaculia bacterium]
RNRNRQNKQQYELTVQRHTFPPSFPSDLRVGQRGSHSGLYDFSNRCALTVPRHPSVSSTFPSSR